MMSTRPLNDDSTSSITRKNQILDMLARARDVAERITSWRLKDSALCTIAMELAKVDVQQALEAEEEIEGADYEVIALRAIATESGKQNPNQAIGLFDRALDAARGIDPLHGKASAMGAIAAGLYKLDSIRAVELFQQVLDEVRANDLFIISDLATIASQLREMDLGVAVALFERVLKVAEVIAIPFWRTMILYSVAIELAKVDAWRAWEVVDRMNPKFEGPGETIEAQALAAVAAELWETEPEIALFLLDEAVAVAEDTEDPLDKARGLCAIASQIGERDLRKTVELFNQALGAASEFFDAAIGVPVIRGILWEFAKLDVQRVKGVAEGIRVETHEGSVLRIVLVELAKLDAKQAVGQLHRTLEAVTRAQFMYKPYALGAIAAELGKLDPKQAEELFDGAICVAEGITMGQEKAWALGVIAVELAKVDRKRALDLIRRALEAAEAIRSSLNDVLRRKDQMTRYIAKNVSKIYADVHEVADLAGRIRDPFLRARFLLEIAHDLGENAGGPLR